MEREVRISFPPVRIVSLVPSITEYLLDIGAPVVGRTKFCVHPANKVKAIPTVGGTKNFKIEKVAGLDPDLIIGNKEENYREGIEELAKRYPVWMSDIVTLQDQYQMMHEVGKITKKEDKATIITSQVQSSLDSVRKAHGEKVLYLIWKNPWMAAGRQTFIHSLLEYIGYENCIQESRYPQLFDETIEQVDPQIIMLSSEPFPFREKHIEEVSKLWPNAEVVLVDGEMYSWYGSRIIHLI